MNTEIKWNEDNWHKNILAFHTYLNQTVESLTDQKKIIRIEPLPSNPRKSALGKRIPVVLPAVKPSKIVPLVQTDEEQVKVVRSRRRRRYSSPLWVDLGDENPGQSNTPIKHKKETK